MSMSNELVLKEKNQLSVNVNSFDGIVSVQKLQLTIRESLAVNDELYFVDEIEKIIREIGNTVVENNYTTLMKKYELLKKKKEEHQTFIDNFNQKYYEKKEEIKQRRKEKQNLLSEEQKNKRREYIERYNKGEITQDQLKDLMLKNTELYNEKRNAIKNFKDIEGINLKTDVSSYHLEELVYKKLTSDFFTDAQWKEKEIKEHELEIIKKKISSLNQFISKLSSVNFSSYMSEFASLFSKESFEGVDIIENVKKIKSNLNKLKTVLLPIALIQGASDNMALKVIGRLMINTTFYGKKDDDTIRKNAGALKADLEEFSFYSIQKGIKEYCKNNKDYPALKDLVDVIQPKHNKGLVLFANIQFLLNL